MTKDEIMAMVQGKETDAAVAEHVFGWTGRKIVYRWDDRKKHERPLIIFTNGDSRYAHNYNPFVDESGTKINYSEPHKVFFPPDYSTDISAAWEVRQWLLDHIGGVTLVSLCDDNPECCETYRGKGEKEIFARAKTAPLAICRAALIASLDQKGAITNKQAPR